MLTAELRLHGVRVVALERDREAGEHARGLGLHVRSIEILDQRGLLPRFLAAGKTYPVGGSFGGIPLPTPVPVDGAQAYILRVPQNVTERPLTEHALQVGAEIRRGCRVADLMQDDDAVTVELADGERLRVRYPIDCDRGRSTVRQLLGLGFPNEPSRIDWLLAEVEVAASPEELTAAAARVPTTPLAFGPAPCPPEAHRFVVGAKQVADHRANSARPPTLEEFTQRLRSWPRLEVGRAGGWAPPALVDSYESERRPVSSDWRPGSVIATRHTAATRRLSPAGHLP